MSRLAPFLGLLLAGVGSGAWAQTPDELARLARLEQRAAAFAARRDSAGGVALARHDTVQAGPLLVLTDSAGSRLLRDALAELRERLGAALGTDTIASLTRAVVVVRFGPPDAGWARLIAGDVEFIQVSSPAATVRRLRVRLVQALQQILVTRGGRSMTEWRPDLRLFEDPRPLFEATYVELLTSPLPGAQRCFAGDLAACRYVLGLIGAEVPSASTRARGTVLLAARESAGVSAIARFFADTGAAIVPRLEAAAGTPLDSLLAAWRATILAHRPRSTGMQWLAVVWVIGLTALATRSTRWR